VAENLPLLFFLFYSIKGYGICRLCSPLTGLNLVRPPFPPPAPAPVAYHFFFSFLFFYYGRVRVVSLCIDLGFPPAISICGSVFHLSPAPAPVLKVVLRFPAFIETEDLFSLKDTSFPSYPPFRTETDFHRNSFFHLSLGPWFSCNDSSNRGEIFLFASLGILVPFFLILLCALFSITSIFTK